MAVRSFKIRDSAIAVSGAAAFCGILLLGIYWAFSRGAPDFSVFYEACRLTLQGHGSSIYGATPDRFLYAPGFAWLLAPLGWFSRGVALGLWCAAKVAFVFAAARAIARGLERECDLSPSAAWGVSAWAFVFVARPALIDFQYGQVNLFVAAICIRALALHFEDRSPIRSAFWGFALGFAATIKLYALPLVLAPWLAVPSRRDDGAREERWSVTLGIAAALFLPVFTENFGGARLLLHRWVQAVLDRGFPLDSHNQSVPALIYRYLGGTPAHVVAEGPGSRTFGWSLLAPPVLQLISMAWFFFTGGLLFGWLTSNRSWIRKPLNWSARAVALVIPPLHLVWKPYFVMGYPLAATAIARVIRAPKISRLMVLAAAFSFLNLATFDVVGHSWIGQLETASVMMLAYLVMLGWG